MQDKINLKSSKNIFFVPQLPAVVMMNYIRYASLHYGDY